MIARDPIHSGAGQARAAKDIAAANHNADLHTECTDVLQFIGNAGENVGIDAVVTVSHQRLTAEL